MTFIAYIASFMFCLNSLYLLLDYYQYAHMTVVLLIQHTQTRYAEAGLLECTEISSRTDAPSYKHPISIKKTTRPKHSQEIVPQALLEKGEGKKVIGR